MWYSPNMTDARTIAATLTERQRGPVAEALELPSGSYSVIAPLAVEKALRRKGIVRGKGMTCFLTKLGIEIHCVLNEED